MADLVTTRELAVWTQNDPDEVAADPYALEVLEKVSGLVRFLAGHSEWELATTPFDARLVALMVAKRAYANPDQEISSNVGPIGSRVLDVAALLLDLTDTERATLVGHNASGDPGAKGSGLWVQRTTTPAETRIEEVLYVGDDQQINLHLSSDPREWMIPMFNPGDPGDPNLYPEEG